MKMYYLKGIDFSVFMCLYSNIYIRIQKLPNGILNRRCCGNHHRLIFYRMHKLQPPGMEVNRAVGIAAFGTVFQITFYDAGFRPQ